ncbi:MAG TPA: ISKra4 family transposase [Anaerolineae bacterium]|nr:ISKra4 family transposase [Anaerolineae bacterium]
MGAGFFPLDEWLGLGEHNGTPESIKQALSLGVEIPSYRRAAERFEGLTKLPLSKSSLNRLAKEYGGQVVAQQAAEAEAMVKAPTKDEEIVWRAIPEPDSAVMNVSMDGVLINIRGEGWKEVKTVTISAVEAEVALERDEEKEVRLSQHSYRAGLWEAQEFAKQQWAEGCRRGLEKAQQIVSVNDGAVWIWLIVAMCYAPCVEIIDWWHAVEKIWAAANSLWGQGEAQTLAWVQQQKDRLWAGQLRVLLHQVRQVCPRGQELNDKVRALVNYLFHHRRRMNYVHYRQAGYPVGSGSVEAGCKVVVQERLKQAGMRWSREGAQAMLALRCVLLSDRWDDVWTSLMPTSKLA